MSRQSFRHHAEYDLTLCTIKAVSKSDSRQAADANHSTQTLSDFLSARAFICPEP